MKGNECMVLLRSKLKIRMRGFVFAQTDLFQNNGKGGGCFLFSTRYFEENHQLFSFGGSFMNILVGFKELF